MKKRIKIVIIILFIISIAIYIILKNKKVEISTNTVTLSKNNSYITTENNITTIKKYNGSADTIVIDKEILKSNTLSIDVDAFLECSNLDTILIDKTIDNNSIKIQNFKINNEYESDKYIEYKNTQDYSESYKKYLELSEEERVNSVVTPDKFDVPINTLYTESM